jgi:hypothetical protein
MPRKPEGDKALTVAERSVRKRVRKAERERELSEAMRRIVVARTLAEAQAIAASLVTP